MGKVRGEGERVRNLPVRRRRSSGVNNYKGGRERERERERVAIWLGKYRRR